MHFTPSLNLINKFKWQIKREKTKGIILTNKSQIGAVK